MKNTENTKKSRSALLAGLQVGAVTSFSDSRGYFLELYNEFRPGIPEELHGSAKQVNISFSTKGVIRGMHFQTHPPQGKLLRVVKGKALFVELDIRPNSPTFGQTSKILLTEDGNNSLWVPYGFANGFQAIEDVLLAYVCTGGYNPATEKSISPLSPQVSHAWEEIFDENGQKVQILSEKDKNALFFDDFVNFLEEIM